MIEEQLAKEAVLTLSHSLNLHPWTLRKARFSTMKLTSPGEKGHRFLQQDLTQHLFSGNQKSFPSEVLNYTYKAINDHQHLNGMMR